MTKTKFKRSFKVNYSKLSMRQLKQRAGYFKHNRKDNPVYDEIYKEYKKEIDKRK